MKILSIIIWLVFGILSVLLAFNSARKEWYYLYKEEYWNSRYESALHVLLLVSPTFILAGLFSYWIILLFTPSKYRSLWFKIPKDKL